MDISKFIALLIVTSHVKQLKFSEMFLLTEVVQSKFSSHVRSRVGLILTIKSFKSHFAIGPCCCGGHKSLLAMFIHITFDALVQRGHSFGIGSISACLDGLSQAVVDGVTCVGWRFPLGTSCGATLHYSLPLEIDIPIIKDILPSINHWSF